MLISVSRTAGPVVIGVLFISAFRGELAYFISFLPALQQAPTGAPTVQY